MSEIRLYMDEDTLRGALLQALRNAGVDLVTTADVNNLGQIDSEQLIWATLHQRVIYTFNGRDFCRLHKTYMEENRSHTGIIIAERQSYSVGEQLRGIQRLIATKTAEEMINQLVFIGAYVREE